MKAHKVEDVDYDISLKYDDCVVDLEWKSGELYLTISSLLLTGKGKKKWYELPISEIRDIKIEEDSPFMIRFTFDNFDVVISGARREILAALRNLLRPYVDN